MRSEFMIAAPGSGSGKTTITCALLAALTGRGLDVRAFKCGPDYIDPIFHNEVLGIRSRNLDTFFSDGDTLRALYAYDNECDVTVTEGVMGLYDGLSPDSEVGSSYEIARILNLPIILVIDAHGMSRSVIALIKGFLSMDTHGLIRGVILNRMNGSYCERIAPIIEADIGIKVYGYCPKLEEGISGERYLGLKLPAKDEVGTVREKIGAVADQLNKSVDIDGILESCKSLNKNDDYAAEDKTFPSDRSGIYHIEDHVSEKVYDNNLPDIHMNNLTGTDPVRIAIARDEAFCFYYEDNLRLLKEAGAQLVEFSPLSDNRLPDDICGMILGGGYPELYADRLSSNTQMLDSVRSAIADGMPSLAECGGFMYLHDRMRTVDDQTYGMVGAIPGTCSYSGHLVRFGMVSVKDNGHRFLSPDTDTIRGHEFHYYDSDNNGSDCTAVKVSTGKNWTCAHVSDDHWWGFAHLNYLSDPAFVRHFITQCMKYRGFKKS